MLQHYSCIPLQMVNSAGARWEAQLKGVRQHCLWEYSEQAHVSTSKRRAGGELGRGALGGAAEGRVTTLSLGIFRASACEHQQAPRRW